MPGYDLGRGDALAGFTLIRYPTAQEMGVDLTRARDAYLRLHRKGA